jgi:NAD(P)H-hydrate epimerase
VPANVMPYYLLKDPEILLKSTNDGGRYVFTEENAKEWLGYDVVAYGMGMTCCQDVAEGAAYLLRNYTGKLILDADGLNSLAAYKKEELSTLFANKKCDVLLTPHLKEFSRLSGNTMEEILYSGWDSACRFAQEHDVNVLLKNASSVITDGERVVINTAGNSGLAKGGSGDVLSGVIAGLCAQGLSTFDGACLGAFLVGKSAEFAAKEQSEYALTATGVIAYLGKTFCYLKD